MEGFFGNINVQFYIAAYLIGGIPFGYLIGKYFSGVDITQFGSGSIGATNVLRVLKEKNPALAKKLAALTLFLDAAKGAVVILIAMALGVSEKTQWAIAVLSVIGHCFSPYLKFEGGKGVATAFGVILVLLPVEALVGLAVWFGVGKLSKVSSLSSLSGVLAAVFSSLFIHPDIPVIHSHAPLFIIGFLIVYKHIPNIIRLFQKQEQAVL